MPDISRARFAQTQPRDCDSPAPSLAAFDFAAFFDIFPLDHPVACFLSSLDIASLMRDIQVAATPLSSQPCYCRGETVRKRDSAREQLTQLDAAFAAVAREGLSVDALRADFASAQARLDAAIAADVAWERREVAAKAEARVGTKADAREAAANGHRRALSDPHWAEHPETIQTFPPSPAGRRPQPTPVADQYPVPSSTHYTAPPPARRPLPVPGAQQPRRAAAEQKRTYPARAAPVGFKYPVYADAYPLADSDPPSGSPGSSASGGSVRSAPELYNYPTDAFAARRMSAPPRPYALRADPRYYQ